MPPFFGLAWFYFQTTFLTVIQAEMQSFASDGIDEQRAAAKKIIYESLVCEYSQQFRVPSVNRYKVSTIKEAGFTVDKKLCCLLSPHSNAKGLLDAIESDNLSFNNME